MLKRGRPAKVVRPNIQTRPIEPTQNPETARLISSLPFSANGYYFTEVIGSGSYAVVFKVHHDGYNRDFAAKLISTKSRWFESNSSIQTEIYSLRRLFHPNIIKIYDSFTFSDHLVMILQYCGQGTLRNIVRPGYGLCDSLRIPMTQAILSALAFSHSRHIAHRDIKLANVFLGDEGRPILADFGMASLQEREDQKLEIAGGALQYRPPEMIHGIPHDPLKADVWSAGVLFYMMITGNSPWPTYNMQALKDSVIAGKYEIPENPDPNIWPMITSMLNTDPDQRPSIAELLESDIFQERSAAPKRQNMRVVSSCLYLLKKKPRDGKGMEGKFITKAQSFDPGDDKPVSLASTHTQAITSDNFM